MPIEFRCPSCSRILRTPDESAGKKAKCPECAAIVDIPTESTSQTPGPTDGAPAWSPAPKNESLSGFQPQPTGNAPASSFAASDSAGGERWRSEPAPNPYSAPEMPTEDPRETSADAAKSNLPPLTPTVVSLDDFITRPWELVKSQFLMAIALGMVVVGLASLSGAPGQVLNIVGAVSRNIYLQMIGMALLYGTNLLVQSWIQLGATKVGLHWARTGEVQIGELFTVSKLFLRGLGLLTIMAVLFLTAAVVCFFPLVLAIFSRNQELALLAAAGGMLVYFPIATVLWLQLYFAFPVLVDRQTGVFESIRLSMTYVSGNRFNLFLTGIVVGACSLLGALCTCFFGLMILPAVQAIFNTTAYLLATGQAVHRPAPSVKKVAPAPEPSMPTANPESPNPPT